MAVAAVNTKSIRGIMASTSFHTSVKGNGRENIGLYKKALAGLERLLKWHIDKSSLSLVVF